MSKVVYHKENGVWIVQGLTKDITAQGSTLFEAFERFGVLLDVDVNAPEPPIEIQNLWN